MFQYKKFEELCEKKKVTPYQVSISTGVSTATLTSWKKGEYTPKVDKILAIAKFFDVSIDFFIKENNKNTVH